MIRKTLKHTMYLFDAMDVDGIPYCYNKSKWYNAFSCIQIFFVDRGLIDY
ncbi:MAG: hypothetical protein ISS66_10980 [Desulfobacteraceae bacterium]|nr:hypothetical protein [Desulfobacteraceae bacterium]